MKKINILHIVGEMNVAGAECYIMELLRNIDRERFCFSFLASGRGFFDDEIVSLGGKLHYLEYTGGIGQKLKAMKAFFALHKGEFDIVHIPTINSKTFAFAKIAQKQGVKAVISHAHTAFVPAEKRFLHRLFIPLLNRYSDVLLACSKNSARCMFGKKGAERAVIAKNGIYIDKFDFNEEKRAELRRAYGLEEKFVYGIVSALRRDKNYDFLLDVFSLLHKKNGDARLLIVGDGEYRAAIEAKAAQAGLTDKLVMAGRQSGVGAYLSAMDYFIFPSLYEGLPLSLVEAQASGLKITAADTITDEVKLTANLRFLPLEVGAEAWAEAIEKDAVYQRTSLADRVRVCGYGVEDTVKEMEALYAALAARSD